MPPGVRMKPEATATEATISTETIPPIRAETKTVAARRSEASGSTPTIALVVTLAALVACAGQGADPAAAQAWGCRERAKQEHGQIVLASSASTGGAVYEDRRNRHIYACSFAGGRPFDLGEGYTNDTSWSLPATTFAGDDAVVELTFRERASYLIAVDLHRRKRTFARALGGDEGPSAPGRWIGRIVLKPDGSLAWTEQYSYLKPIEGGSKTC